MSREVFQRIYETLRQVNALILDRKRDPARVLRYIRRIVDDPNFYDVLVPLKLLDWADEWSRFYQDVFGMEIESRTIANAHIPSDTLGVGWVVMVDSRLTPGMVREKCEEMLPSDAGTKSAMTDPLTIACPSYAKRFVVVDEQMAQDMGDLAGIKPVEKLLLELWCVWKTGSLDPLKGETRLYYATEWRFSGGGSVFRFETVRRSPNEHVLNLTVDL